MLIKMVCGVIFCLSDLHIFTLKYRLSSLILNIAARGWKTNKWPGCRDVTEIQFCWLSYFHLNFLARKNIFQNHVEKLCWVKPIFEGENESQVKISDLLTNTSTRKGLITSEKQKLKTNSKSLRNVFAGNCGEMMSRSFGKLAQPN